MKLSPNEERQEVLQILKQSSRFVTANEVFERSGFRAKSRCVQTLNELITLNKVTKLKQGTTFYYRLEG